MAQSTLRLSTRDKNLRKQLTLSEEELRKAIEQRDALQREVHALNDQLRVLKKNLMTA